MRNVVFDLFQGAFFGSIVGFTIFSSYASYVNTNEILSLLKNPPVVEETMEERIERYKDFPEKDGSESIFLDTHYTIRGC